MAKTNTIKPFESYPNVPDTDIVNRALNVVTSVGNAAVFTNHEIRSRSERPVRHSVTYSWR